VASFSTIRTAIKTTLADNISGLRVYDTIDDMINVPACVVVPTSIDFNEAMARGTDKYDFDVLVVVSRADSRSGQNQLDSFINGSGSNSIRQAIFQNSTLGQSDTSAVVTTMSDYGGTYAVNGVESIGARLGVTVYTKGSS
jgi:hypothetical protein|tara:strand:- start:417 stop:839 length:423 start_codon:yes stop_codon:yes gene_type:complete